MMVAIDTEPDLKEKVTEVVDAGLSAEQLAETLPEVVEQYLNPIGNGYGRHALMDLVRTVRHVGSLWRIDWLDLAEHLITESGRVE